MRPPRYAHSQLRFRWGRRGCRPAAFRGAGGIQSRSCHSTAPWRNETRCEHQRCSTPFRTQALSAASDPCRPAFVRPHLHFYPTLSLTCQRSPGAKHSVCCSKLRAAVEVCQKKNSRATEQRGEEQDSAENFPSAAAQVARHAKMVVDHFGSAGRNERGGVSLNADFSPQPAPTAHRSALLLAAPGWLTPCFSLTHPGKGSLAC